jgi:hypothetical protein
MLIIRDEEISTCPLFQRPLRHIQILIGTAKVSKSLSGLNSLSLITLLAFLYIVIVFYIYCYIS